MELHENDYDIDASRTSVSRDVSQKQRNCGAVRAKHMGKVKSLMMEARAGRPSITD